MVKDSMNYSSTVTYTQPVLGPQGAVVSITKYLPLSTGPKKKSLQEIFRGDIKEHCS